MALGLATGIYAGGKALYGGYQAIKASKELDRLSRQGINVEEDPFLRRAYDKALKREEMGLTSIEEGRYKTDVESALQADREAIRSNSPSGGAFLSKYLGARRLGSYNRIAELDAKTRMENSRYADQLGGRMSAYKTMRENQEREYRRAKEVELGRAKQDGIQNIFSSLGDLSYLEAAGVIGKKTLKTIGAE